MPKSWTFRRFRNLKNLPIYKAILKFPLVFVSFVLDHILFFQANQETKKQGGLGYW